MLDLCVCINLDRRPDRLKWMEFQLQRERLSFLRIAAVDGLKLHPKLVPKTPGLGWPPGIVGCTLSHCAAIEVARASGAETVLILEDDVVLPDGFYTRITELFELLPDDWGIVSLGGWHRAPPLPVWNGVSKLTNTLCSHAYMLRQPAYRVVQRALRSKQAYPDTAIAAAQSLVPSYGADQIHVGQRADYSDIWDREMTVKDDRLEVSIDATQRSATGEASL